MCQIHLSDNYVSTSQASQVEDDNIVDTESYSATKCVSSGKPATKYHIADIPQNSNDLHNNTERLELCGPATYGIDASHDTYISLTREAIVQHNTKDASPDGDKATRYSFSQHYPYGNLGHTAVHTPIPLVDDHQATERHFYPQPSPRLYISATPQQEDEHTVGLGSGYLQQPIEHQGLHPYPAAIHQGDLDHQTGQVEVDCEELQHVKQLLQVWTSCGNALLAGVGAQFTG